MLKMWESIRKKNKKPNKKKPRATLWPWFENKYFAMKHQTKDREGGQKSSISLWVRAGLCPKCISGGKNLKVQGRGRMGIWVQQSFFCSPRGILGSFKCLGQKTPSHTHHIDFKILPDQLQKFQTQRENSFPLPANVSPQEQEGGTADPFLWCSLGFSPQAFQSSSTPFLTVGHRTHLTAFVTSYNVQNRSFTFIAFYFKK